MRAARCAGWRRGRCCRRARPCARRGPAARTPRSARRCCRRARCRPRGPPQPRPLEQAAGVEVVRQHLLDAAVVADAGEVDRQQVGGEVAQLQVDGRELDVNVARRRPWEEIAFLIEDVPRLLELGRADALDARRHLGRPQPALDEQPFEVKVDAGVEQSPPVFEQGGFALEAVAAVERRPGQEDDFRGQEPLGAEVEVVQLDVPQQHGAVEDEALAVRHADDLGGQVGGVADNARQQVAGDQHGRLVRRQQRVFEFFECHAASALAPPASPAGSWREPLSATLQDKPARCNGWASAPQQTGPAEGAPISRVARASGTRTSPPTPCRRGAPRCCTARPPACGRAAASRTPRTPPAPPCSPPRRTSSAPPARCGGRGGRTG